MTRLTPVIPAQQQAPMKIGFPPVFISFTTLVFSPMAPIAMTMKNLLRVFSGLKIPAGTPRLTAAVVIIEAPTKYRIKKGKIFLNSTLFPSSLAFFALQMPVPG